MGSLEGIDAVFVLSVRSFTERISHIERHFAERGVGFEFIFDFDVPDLTTECVREVFGSSTMSPAAKSLVLKHIHAWRLGVERGCRRILVFEDDAILADFFIQRLGGIMECIGTLESGYLVFLGGSDTKVPDEFFLQKGPFIRQPIATAEGYLSDADALKRRLGWLQDHTADQPADHLIKQIDKACGICQYWLENSLVEQGSVFGMFNTSLDGNRQKHSRQYNYLRYHWNRLWRRRVRKWVVRLRYAISRSGMPQS